MTNINIKQFVFAQGGLQLKYPENTIKAYEAAINQNFAVHMNVRVLKDGTLVCFKDKYMKRLLNFPGKIQNFKYGFLKRLQILDTDFNIPSLEKVLRSIRLKNPILIELNVKYKKEDIIKILRICRDKKICVFFYTFNVITYLRFKKISKHYTIWLIKCGKIEFLKGKKYNYLDFIPAFDDIIVEAEDKAQNIIRKIHKTFNKHTTRVDKSHWLLNYNGKKYQITHRAISSNNVKEHSKEGILECVEKNKVIEVDVELYKGDLRCYHSDKISKKLGQEVSIAEKIEIENSICFLEVLNLVKGKVPIIIDIKDLRLKNRNLEILLMKQLENYKGEFCIQSFNPLVLRWFLKKYPHIIRGQVGNSLSSLKRTRNIILLIVNFILFYSNKCDYIVYDLDKYVAVLSKFNNILGLPVIGYTAFCQKDINKYKNLYFDNIIVEGDFVE